MTKMILVPPTPESVLVGSAPVHTFFSRPFTTSVSKLYPSCYSVVRLSDGSAYRYDYTSKVEYDSHKAKVVAAVAELHSRTGKVAGCCCEVCA